MTKKFSLAVVVMSLFMISMQVSAQRTVRVDERVQTTYVNAYNVDVAQWLRIYPGDTFQTEIRNLSINGVSFVTSSGNMEIYAMGRLVARLGFGRIPSQATAHFPMGTRVSDIRIRINGEVHVERVLATVIEHHWYPAPPPMPPRPIPVPPRYPAPAPRPTPPRHEPAPRPRPPRHEPAPRPTPPRHEPAPRPTPPRHEPAPRPAPPRQGPGPGPGPRPGPRR